MQLHPSFLYDLYVQERDRRNQFVQSLSISLSVLSIVIAFQIYLIGKLFVVLSISHVSFFISLFFIAYTFIVCAFCALDIFKHSDAKFLYLVKAVDYRASYLSERAKLNAPDLIPLLWYDSVSLQIAKVVDQNAALNDSRLNVAAGIQRALLSSLLSLLLASLIICLTYLFR